MLLTRRQRSHILSELYLKQFTQQFNKIFRLMSGSCHFDRASIVEIGVEYKIFAIIIFFNFVQVLQFGAHSR